MQPVEDGRPFSRRRGRTSSERTDEDGVHNCAWTIHGTFCVNFRTACRVVHRISTRYPQLFHTADFAGVRSSCLTRPEAVTTLQESPHDALPGIMRRDAAAVRVRWTMMASRRSAGLAPRGRHIAARVVLRLAVCGLAVGWAAGAAAQPAAPSSAAASRAGTPAAPLFRVILSDGSAIVSYGEWARVGDRIVFTMPIGDVAGEPMLQLVSLPGAAVDWAATERYAHGVRYDHYVATRADTDFAEFSGHITELLKEVSLASEPVRRLDLAERARRELTIWPREHYGYRAGELREIEEMLDATVSELRAAAGVRAFDLDLVAAVESPAMPLLPDPSPAQSIGQAMAVARLADSPAERQALLTAVVAAIDGGRAGDASGWLGLVRGDALSELAAERATDEAYARLAHSRWPLRGGARSAAT